MFIYQPYFYIIQEVSSGIYYAGIKYGKNANPKFFMKENGYLTSSKIVKKLIKENGIDSFTIRRIKVFENSRQAYEYETKFLRKVNAKNNLKFYNGHNNEFSSEYNSNWRKIPDKNGITSYQKGGKKSAETKIATIIDGKNICQLAYEKALINNPMLNKIRGEKSRQSKLIVNKDGLNSYQMFGQKMSGENNPSKKPENAKKISDSRKNYIRNNTEAWAERQRKVNKKLSTERDGTGLTVREKHSLWMQENNPTKGSIWINNGTNNLRIKKGESIPEGYSVGRLKRKILQ
jgi:hypothetical protein